MLRHALALCLPLAGPAAAAERAITAAGCYTDYFPMAAGSEWEYRSVSRTQAAGAASDFVMDTRQTVAELTPDSVTVSVATVSVQAGERKQETHPRLFRCGAEGPVDGPAQGQGYQVVYTGSEVPLTSTPGTHWQTRMDTRMAQGMDSQVTTHQVVGMEKVTVAAGEFDALKVSFEHVVRDQPGLRIVRTGYRWYAPKVGLVRTVSRTVSTYAGGSQESESVEELVAFRP